MKKSFIIVFFVCLMLLFTTEIDAKTVCKYQSPSELGNIIVELTLEKDSSVVKFVNVNINECNIDTKYTDSCPKLYSGYRLDHFYTKQNEQSDLFEYKLIDANKLTCGSAAGMITGIPKKIPELTSFIMIMIQVAVPVILVIFGSIDFFKGMSSGKEDEIKKGQKIFIKRLVLAVLIFLILIIVKFIISIIADTNALGIADCIDCFASNDCGY